MNELAAALTRGPVEVLDFLLPLWAGASLGASPAQVGLLTAVETLTSFAARPIAGVLADRFDRGRLASVGAAIYACSFVLYAVTPGLALAYPAAVLGGVGGALFWVALRARVGEGLADDDAAYAKLFAAEGTGTWIAFVAAMTLVTRVDYRGVFAIAGGACLVAAVVLGRRDGVRPVDRGRTPGLRQVGQRMRPMLVLVAVTATAETGVALLLLLHLQRGHQLELGEIAAVFLPGFIVYTVLPEYLHGFVRRFGRTRMLSAAMVASAGFALVLSFAPNPYVIAGLWILSAVAYAVAIPTEQAVVAEAAGLSLGRGMGIYESATLLGATVGALSAGLLYQSDGNGWQLACLAAAAVLLTAALLTRPALRHLAIPDHPSTPEPATLELSTPDALTAEPSTPEPPAPTPAHPEQQRPTSAPAPTSDPNPTDQEAVTPPDLRTRNRRSLKRWTEHAALFLAVQLILALIDQSWPRDALEHGVRAGTTWWNWLLAINTDSPGPLKNATRIWCLVLLIDTLWTALLLATRRRAPSKSSPN